MKINLGSISAKLPPEYFTLPRFAMEPVLIGKIREPREINLTAITESSSNGCKTGFEMLSCLVKNFKFGKESNGMAYYPVSQRDRIQGHFNLFDMRALLLEWKNLPPYFKTWAKGKRLYAWRSVLRYHGGQLFVPCLDFTTGSKPKENYYHLSNSLDENDIPLCDHVFPR